MDSVQGQGPWARLETGARLETAVFRKVDDFGHGWKRLLMLASASATLPWLCKRFSCLAKRAGWSQKERIAVVAIHNSNWAFIAMNRLYFCLFGLLLSDTVLHEVYFTCKEVSYGSPEAQAPPPKKRKLLKWSHPNNFIKYIYIFLVSRLNYLVKNNYWVVQIWY